MKNIETMSDIEIMARTIYGEARGEYSRIDGGLAALIAVGNVIMNSGTAANMVWPDGSRGMFKTLSIFVLE